MIEQPLEPLNIAIAVAIMAIGSALQAPAGAGHALVAVPVRELPAAFGARIVKVLLMQL